MLSKKTRLKQIFQCPVKVCENSVFMLFTADKKTGMIALGFLVKNV